MNKAITAIFISGKWFFCARNKGRSQVYNVLYIKNVIQIDFKKKIWGRVNIPATLFNEISHTFLKCLFFSVAENIPDGYSFYFKIKLWDYLIEWESIEVLLRARQGASLVAQWLRIACQCRGHGFEPWAGKIPHAAEQLGPWARITEPARLEPVLRNKRGPRIAMKSGPRLLQLEKAHAQKRRPNTAKNK